jgi:hypothetical protein
MAGLYLVGCDVDRSLLALMCLADRHDWLVPSVERQLGLLILQRARLELPSHGTGMHRTQIDIGGISICGNEVRFEYDLFTTTVEHPSCA